MDIIIKFKILNNKDINILKNLFISLLEITLIKINQKKKSEIYTLASDNFLNIFH